MFHQESQPLADPAQFGAYEHKGVEDATQKNDYDDEHTA